MATGSGLSDDGGSAGGEDGPSSASAAAAVGESQAADAMVTAVSAGGSKGEAAPSVVSRHSSGFPVEKWVEKFKRRPPEILSELELKSLCQHIKDILAEENNVQPVPAPVTICGDIHGQFYDLLALFEVGGQLPEQDYIFLGDYVDRGHNSVETFQYLLILKLMYPSRVTLLRGNHESRQITQVYGFYDECVRKYGNSNPWKYCTDLFDYLTLAAVVDQRIFCVHGGLSPAVKLVDQLRVIHRTQEIPHEGPFGDIVWSDPDDFLTGWAVNPRGAGWLFGGGITREFNRVNDFDLIARAHQLAMDGYKYAFGPDNPLVTVWSAPNYCYRCGNVAAIMHVDKNYGREFILFKETPESNATNQATVPYFL